MTQAATRQRQPIVKLVNKTALSHTQASHCSVSVHAHQNQHGTTNKHANHRSASMNTHQNQHCTTRKNTQAIVLPQYTLIRIATITLYVRSTAFSQFIPGNNNTAPISRARKPSFCLSTRSSELQPSPFYVRSTAFSQFIPGNNNTPALSKARKQSFCLSTRSSELQPSLFTSAARLSANSSQATTTLLHSQKHASHRSASVHAHQNCNHHPLRPQHGFQPIHPRLQQHCSNLKSTQAIVLPQYTLIRIATITLYVRSTAFSQFIPGYNNTAPISKARKPSFCLSTRSSELQPSPFTSAARLSANSSQATTTLLQSQKHVSHRSASVHAHQNCNHHPLRPQHGFQPIHPRLQQHCSNLKSTQAIVLPQYTLIRIATITLYVRSTAFSQFIPGYNNTAPISRARKPSFCLSTRSSELQPSPFTSAARLSANSSQATTTLLQSQEHASQRSASVHAHQNCNHHPLRPQHGFQPIQASDARQMVEHSV